MRPSPAVLLALLAAPLLAQTPAPTAAPPPAAAAPNRGQTVTAAAATAPLPFVTQPALGGLRFDNPVAIVAAPGETNRLFIVERAGRIIAVPDLKKPERVTFLDVTSKTGNTDFNERGLLGLAFHPDYRKNRQFYLWFTMTPSGGSGSAMRLARFTTSATDPAKADPDSEQPLISQTDRAVNHNGGQLAFGRDGYLYLSIGDEGGGGDQYQNSQRIDGNFFAGIIRIDVDKKVGSLPPNPHPSVHAGTYAVPLDNPWVGAATFNNQPVEAGKVRTEFWAVGLRNAWRWSFDTATGRLWLGDVGQDRIEEVDVIRRGGNYGWNFREGEQGYAANRGRGGRAAGTAAAGRQPPEGVKFDEPIFTYLHDTNGGNCITGGIVYRGTALPALTGRYIFADYVSGRIWALNRLEFDRDEKPIGPVTAELIARRPGIVDFAQDPQTGDLLLANISSGNIERLVPNPAAK